MHTRIIILPLNHSHSLVQIDPHKAINLVGAAELARLDISDKACHDQIFRYEIVALNILAGNHTLSRFLKHLTSNGFFESITLFQIARAKRVILR